MADNRLYGRVPKSKDADKERDLEEFQKFLKESDEYATKHQRLHPPKRRKAFDLTNFAPGGQSLGKYAGGSTSRSNPKSAAANQAQQHDNLISHDIGVREFHGETDTETLLAVVRASKLVCPGCRKKIKGRNTKVCPSCKYPLGCYRIGRAITENLKVASAKQKNNQKNGNLIRQWGELRQDVYNMFAHGYHIVVLAYKPDMDREGVPVSAGQMPHFSRHTKVFGNSQMAWDFVNKNKGVMSGFEKSVDDATALVRDNFPKRKLLWNNGRSFFSNLTEEELCRHPCQSVKQSWMNGVEREAAVLGANVEMGIVAALDERDSGDEGDDAASADEPAEDLSLEEPTEDLSLEEPARRLFERRPAEDIANTSRKPAEDFSLDAPARRHLERRSAEDLLKTSRRYAEDRSNEEPARRPLEKRPAEDLSKTSQRPAEDLPKEDPQKNTLEDLSGSSKSLHQVRGKVVASQIRVLSKSTLDLPIPTKRRKMKSARVETITKNLRSVPAAKEARATNEEEDFDYYIHNYINSKKQ